MEWLTLQGVHYERMLAVATSKEEELSSSLLKTFIWNGYKPRITLAYSKACFPLGEFVRANREKSKLIGWRQTLTTSPPNHIRFLLVRAKKFAKWKTGLNKLRQYVNTITPYQCDIPVMPLFIALLAVPIVAGPVLFSINSDISNSPSPALLPDKPNRSSIPAKIIKRTLINHCLSHFQ